MLKINFRTTIRNMKKNSVFTLSLLSFFVIALLPACNWQVDYSKYTTTLDSLITEVKLVSSYLDTINAEDLEEMKDSAEERLNYIQKNFVGDMRKDIGLAAGNYKIEVEYLEKTAELIEKSKEEAPITLEQLANLKKTLTENATEDAAGNKIDEEYVKKAIGRETEEAGKLIKAKEILSKDIKQAKERYMLQSPKIQYWVDSIPELKGPKEKK